jgi:hypothetical protein
MMIVKPGPEKRIHKIVKSFGRSLLGLPKKGLSGKNIQAAPFAFKKRSKGPVWSSEKK